MIHKKIPAALSALAVVSADIIPTATAGGGNIGEVMPESF